MSADGTGRIYISWKDWTDFVLEYAPFLKATEFALRFPQQGSDGLEVDYAFSDEVSPEDWVTKPEWMKEKK